jgi:hypothetical protein
MQAALCVGQLTLNRHRKRRSKKKIITYAVVKGNASVKIQDVTVRGNASVKIRTVTVRGNASVKIRTVTVKGTALAATSMRVIITTIASNIIAIM